MKCRLLILASAILAGCSDTPSSGDIKETLASAVSSCKNVEVFDVKKTNGFQDDGFYRVEYTYGARLKDEKSLKKMKELWEEEKHRDAEYKVARAAYEEKEKAIKSEIEAIEASFGALFRAKHPREDAILSKPRGYDNESIDAHKAAMDVFYSERSDALGEKEKKLKELKLEWDKSREGVPSSVIRGNEGAAMYKFYREGCSSQGIKYIEGLSRAHAELVERANTGVWPESRWDQSLWFEAQEVKMNGVMPMRKTEQGWRTI